MYDYIINTMAVLILLYVGVCIVYFFIQEKFIFVPTWPGDPFESKLATPCEEIILNTPNKGQIHCLLLSVEAPKGIIIYLHGNTGSLKRWQFMAEELSGYGYDVFVPDFRGYGQSKGRRSESFMHRDMEFCYEYIIERFPNKKLLIYGRSLGCAFATRLASRKSASKVVLETPFFNLIETGKYYLPFLPIKYLLRYRFRSDIYIQHIDCPVRIFHGTKDIVVPHSQALQLFRHAEKHKRDVSMVTIVGGKHANLNSFPAFREKLEEFLQE